MSLNNPINPIHNPEHPVQTKRKGTTICHVWSIPDGKEIVTYQSHDNTIFATAISPDGRVVATGGGNKRTIHLWSLHNGKLQQRLSGVGAAIFVVGFSSDDKMLAWEKKDVGSSNAQREPFEYTITLPTKAEALDSKESSLPKLKLWTPKRVPYQS